MEEGREILQQGTIAKKVKLRAEGLLRVACQMDTHTKKKKRSSSSTSNDKEHCDRLGRSLVTTSWHALITSCTQRSRSRYDFALKREWQREYDMRGREPNLWPHPSPMKNGSSARLASIGCNVHPYSEQHKTRCQWFCRKRTRREFHCNALLTGGLSCAFFHSSTPCTKYMF